ncbi:anti-sigma factor family protein [Streptomyces sp. NPDC060194]|uniref:anti-sigma factor family protein n=1 Tax=Streptomyces sp. NPDC060194 TaxID=3347069 RepID=UPI003646919E
MNAAAFRGPAPDHSSEPETSAEQHLGDRLAALVDGELEHDARERVLAHLATCPRCKAEADAQRRLKSMFGADPTPLPSEGLLARLQGLPGGDGPGPLDPPRRPGFGSGVFDVGGEPGFHYLPGGAHSSVIPGGAGESAFPIHEPGRPSGSASRGRRFAWGAAGAVSVAAIALGGAVPVGGAADTGNRGTGAPGNSVTPLRAPASGAALAPQGRRGGAQSYSDNVAERRGSAPRSLVSAAPVAAAPLLPGATAVPAVSPLLQAAPPQDILGKELPR